MPSGDGPKRDKEAHQQEFLQLLRDGMKQARAKEAMRLGHATVPRWRHDPDFRSRMDNVLSGQEVSASTGLPDFLTWRERHCAYLDQRTDTVHRATNTWFQSDAYTQLQKHNRAIIVLPPGHIKTTFFCIEYPTYAVMANRNIRMTFVQKNQNEAKKLVSAVQERLTDHELYDQMAARLITQGDVPITDPIEAYAGTLPFRPEGRETGDKWGAEGFKVAGRTSGEKDDTVQAKGVGSQIQGVRADKIFLDDVQDPEAARKSQSDSEDKLRWFQNVILGRVYDWQQVIILANFFSETDFAHLLIKEHPDWPVINYPALMHHKNSHGTLVPKPLCPEVWTLDGLAAKRKEVGEETWHFTWMQEEGSAENRVFQKEALEAAKDIDYTLGTVPDEVTHVFLGCDPAISQFCAICVWGLNVRNGHRYLIDIFNEKGLRTFSNIQSKILELTETYVPRSAAIEMNNVQGSISNDPDFIRAMRNLGAKVVTYQTRTEMGARAEHDSYDISHIGALFDAGLVTLPYGGTNANRATVDAYVTQLASWRPGIKYLTRDMVMATLFAESEAHPVARRGGTDHPKRPSRAPKFARNREGGWSWRKSALDTRTTRQQTYTG